MAKDRQKLAYIRDKQHLSYAKMEHYRKALNSDDIVKEEYYLQNVFNSPAHAKNLKNEIFQKKKRNDVTNKVSIDSIVYDKNTHLDNKIRIHDKIIGVRYSKITYKQKDHNDFMLEPDQRFGLLCTLEDIIKLCDSNELKVLAYFLVTEKMDNLIVDQFKNVKTLDELRTYVLQIWDLNVNSLGSLNEFVGSKSKGESARKKLAKLIKENLPELIKKG